MTHSASTISASSRQPQGTRRFNVGDRIFVRLTSNLRTVLEFTTTAIGSMTELTGETRRRISNFHGLCSLHVRNMSQGWSTTKPLMIYQNRYTPVAQRPRPERMIFPWETH